MPDIIWTRGDTPLSLSIPMDVTDATVETVIRDYDDSEADTFALPGTVVASETGELSIVSSSIPVGRWQLRTRVLRNGTLVATFPKDGVRQLLTVTPRINEGVPIGDVVTAVVDPEKPDALILNFPSSMTDPDDDLILVLPIGA